MQFLTKKINPRVRKLVSTHKVPSLTVSVLLLAVICLGVVGLASHDSNSKPQDESSEGQQANDSDKSDNSQSVDSAVADAPHKTGTQSPQAVPFQINRVFFSQASVVPEGAHFGQCSIGQQVSYTAMADVTASAAGIAVVHWEVADHLAGEVKKFDDANVTFTSAGTKKVQSSFTYSVRDTGNGTNLYNRQFLNLFVTVPNSTYANKGSEVFAYRNSTEPYFVWGTYIDLC